ncbi:MAG: prepilin peptidase [Alphaproteobacteria bacterium]|nr:prepilin peptidase [Alphaproteobacteria bacterium]
MIFEIIHFLILTVFIVAVVYAACIDIISYTIPNWISVLIVLAFPVAVIVSGSDIGGVITGLSVGAVFMIAGAVLFFTGIFGGGDAKLLAAVSVWVGWEQTYSFIINIALAGGVLSILILISRKIFKKRTPWKWATKLLSDDMGVPYGVAITVAALIFLFSEYNLPNI